MGKRLSRCPICDAASYCDKHGMEFRKPRADTYRGWDQRHDDNKAQGRPIGGQWSDSGVEYIDGGLKVRRARMETDHAE